MQEIPRLTFQRLSRTHIERDRLHPDLCEPIRIRPVFTQSDFRTAVYAQVDSYITNEYQS